ncbi:MAG: hypothetical protein IPN90_03775 [Elusimicrobia bacterium]|nr:hypothetical protein [Elusimicrobiota bacterium]
MMTKHLPFLFVFFLMGCFSLAAEARWSLAQEKKTGGTSPLLQTESKKVLKTIPLVSVREYSPVAYDDIPESKQKTRAMRGGYSFNRLTAKNTSATPIHGGRLLVLQEQTIVMPPSLDVPQGDALELKEGGEQEPDENSIQVTLFDDAGNALWTRTYGPLAGRLPVNRKAWASPAFPEILSGGLPAYGETPAKKTSK